MTDKNLAEGSELGLENTVLAPEGEEQQPPETSSEGEENKAAPADVGKSKTTKYIKKLTKRASNSERENVQLKARIDDLEKRIGPVPDPVRPKRDDYDTDEEYEDKLFDWRDEVQVLKAPKNEPVKAETATIVKEFEAELEAVADDAVLAVMESDDWKCSQDMTDYIMASNNRANLAYHLATNPAISEKIAGMSPILAARELAKVEESLGSSVNNQSIDTLPPPATHGSPSSVTTTDQDKMSTDQWVSQRREGKI